MRLADYIAANTEPILAEWVTFAKASGPAGKTLDLAVLRDHAVAMLADIVADLRTPQTADQQAEKSKGNEQPDPAGGQTAAEVHGAGRAESGFTVGEMVSEYRALRASVIRLWTKDSGSLKGDDIEDLMRFNEAIDQSLAEAVTRYTQDIDRSREIFVAILGHDLRTPLGAVLTASQFMVDSGELREPNLTLATRITLSARRMNQMVGDLLDFTRGRLGSGIPVTKADMDLAGVARQAVDEIKGANPKRNIQFTATGNLQGQWDAGRIGQVVTNLVSNAVEHGDVNAPVSLTVQGEAADVVMRIHNDGTPIQNSALPTLFSPFKRLSAGATVTGPSTNLGLGLYIAERIVTAHGGSIDVRSSAEAGTLVTVRVPR